VLLVFVLLVAPAVGGAMLAASVRARLLIGWACGVAASSAGLSLSAHMDWPPAPAIACVFVVLLMALAWFGHVAAAERRGVVLGRLVLTLAGCAIFGIGIVQGLRLARGAAPEAEAEHSHGPPEHAHGSSRSDLLAALRDEHEQVRSSAARELGRTADASVVAALVSALADPSVAVKESVAQALGALGRSEAVPALEAALARHDPDEWVDLYEAQALASCGAASGVTALLRIAREAEAKLVRFDALRSALEFVGRTGSTLEDASFERTRDEIDAWWRDHAAALRWDAQTRRFVAAR
jgi:HEAT repeats/ABC 3 transport family